MRSIIFHAKMIVADAFNKKKNINEAINEAIDFLAYNFSFYCEKSIKNRGKLNSTKLSIYDLNKQEYEMYLIALKSLGDYIKWCCDYYKIDSNNLCISNLYWFKGVCVK